MTAVTGFMILFFFEVYLFLFMNFTVLEDVVPAFMIISTEEEMKLGIDRVEVESYGTLASADSFRFQNM
ncbi:hypothetical protein QQP08_025498 [Theobroma cacao]|nr:hypothetical protein QQP08_025498 [Theobroma cacao]